MGKATEDCFCRCFFFFFFGLTSKRNGILTCIWQYERINENQLNIIFYFQKREQIDREVGHFRTKGGHEEGAVNL